MQSQPAAETVPELPRFGLDRVAFDHQAANERIQDKLSELDASINKKEIKKPQSVVERIDELKKNLASGLAKIYRLISRSSTDEEDSLKELIDTVETKVNSSPVGQPTTSSSVTSQNPELASLIKANKDTEKVKASRLVRESKRKARAEEQEKKIRRRSNRRKRNQLRLRLVRKGLLVVRLRRLSLPERPVKGYAIFETKTRLSVKGLVLNED